LEFNSVPDSLIKVFLDKNSMLMACLNKKGDIVFGGDFPLKNNKNKFKIKLYLN
jgi:hypothetical protein